MDNELEIVSNETLTATEEVVKNGKVNQYLPILGGTAAGLLIGAVIFYGVEKLIKFNKAKKAEKSSEAPTYETCESKPAES